MFTRLLTLLQFTRIALVFTAIADGWTSMLLQARATGTALAVAPVVAMTVASIALYTFGMSLNDLIDRRRDSQLAPGRPLPSGRMSVSTARIVCAGLAVAAIAAGTCISAIDPAQGLALSPISLCLLLCTLLLIVFYDFTGKYLVAPGLLSLGLVRFLHATIAAPTLAFPWHAITLLVHVTVLSTVCYALEAKRPRLTIRHWLLVGSGLIAVIAIVVSLLINRRVTGQIVPWRIALWIQPGLFYVLAATVTFVALAITLYAQSRDARTAGRSIMLYGLLWLIVYDASFVLGFVGWRPALLVFGLLPLAFIAVQAMRTWSRIVDLSHAPQFQRAR